MKIGIFAATLAASCCHAAAVQAAPRVVELNQVSCQFLEPEQDQNHGYTSAKPHDCEAINAKTGKTRMAKSKTIELQPGKTIFRVSNKDVPYELGFWLRGATLLSRATLPSVSGGGLTTGKTQDYVIDLKPGEYVFSCPLNPTPDYRLIVK